MRGVNLPVQRSQVQAVNSQNSVFYDKFRKAATIFGGAVDFFWLSKPLGWIVSGNESGSRERPKQLSEVNPVTINPENLQMNPFQDPVQRIDLSTPISFFCSLITTSMPRLLAYVDGDGKDGLVGFRKDKVYGAFAGGAGFVLKYTWVNKELPDSNVW